MLTEYSKAKRLTSMTSRFQAKLLAQRALFQRIQSSKKRSKLQAGFTLIELLVVILIVGILSAIAIPSFINQKNKAETAAGNAWAGAHARSCASLLLTGEAGKFAATATEGPNKGAAPTTCAANDTFVGDGPVTADNTIYTVKSDGSVAQ